MPTSDDKNEPQRGGWCLVPVEATEPMLRALVYLDPEGPVPLMDYERVRARELWRDALALAPQPASVRVPQINPADRVLIDTARIMLAELALRPRSVDLVYLYTRLQARAEALEASGADPELRTLLRDAMSLVQDVHTG